MGKGAADIGFTRPCCTGDSHMLCLGHPAATGELAHDGFVKRPFGGEFDPLDASVSDLELGLVKRALEPLVLAASCLRVDKQPEALIKS